MASIRMSQAAAGALAFLLTDALTPQWEYKGVDLSATFLNISGTFDAILRVGPVSLSQLAHPANLKNKPTTTAVSSRRLMMASCAGSFLAGLANGGGAAREDSTNSDIQAAVSIVMSGFLAVWTRSVCCTQQLAVCSRLVLVRAARDLVRRFARFALCEQEIHARQHETSEIVASEYGWTPPLVDSSALAPL